MDSPQALARIKEDQTDGIALKVSSTPSFFVNGIPLVGMDEKNLAFAINSELAGK
jgi:protein-disulfide isomerase